MPKSSLLSTILSPRTPGMLRSLVRYYGLPGKISLMARFYSQFIARGDLCFDLGAHVGDRIRAWARLGARIVAVEPDPVCSDLLQRWYGGQPDITLLQKAVGARPGTGQLFISERNPTLSTLSTQWIQDIKQSHQFSQIEWESTVPVSVTTLDDLIHEHGLPSFCKIDVEGYELEVLEGLSVPIPALSFEYNPVVPDIAQDCISRLMALGDYEFNWTVRELPRLRSRTWLDPDWMVAELRKLTPEARTGDVYACLYSRTWPADGLAQPSE